MPLLACTCQLTVQKSFVHPHADLRHESNPQATVSLAEVKRLASMTGSKEQVREEEVKGTGKITWSDCNG